MFPMRTFFSGLVLLLLASGTQAKYVRFSVDMTGWPIDTNGIHITGDFQTLAGYAGGDWNPATTEMFPVNGSLIYAVVVNIPAGRHYEYKFLNGAATYALEFVPVPSRVDEVIDDNRWIYVDSLSNDTLDIGAIRFSANAPMGKYLLRYQVDLQNEIVPAGGVHVEGSFQQFDPAQTRMCNLISGTTIYQYISYYDSTHITARWRFINGNTTPEAEQVPGACADTGAMRSLLLVKDTVLPVICFASCEACTPNGVATVVRTPGLALYPNPASGQLTLENADGIHQIRILNLTGAVMLDLPLTTVFKISVPVASLPAGPFLVQCLSPAGAVSSHLFMKE